MLNVLYDTVKAKWVSLFFVNFFKNHGVDCIALLACSGDVLFLVQFFILWEVKCYGNLEASAIV